MKRIFYLIIAVLMLLLTGCQAEPDSTVAISSADTVTANTLGTVEVYIFDIGKADAILITTENHAVLIDTGLNKNGDDIAAYLKDRNIEEIDYLIITHFDKDHVGGADIIIEEFFVGQMIVPNYTKDSKQYNQFVDAVEQMELSQTVLTEAEELSFTLDGTSFTVYPSQLEYVDFSDGDEDESKENDFSLVVSLNHGDNNFLFTGDAMATRIEELLTTDAIAKTNYDFLKVPHHGNYNDRSDDFIASVQPTYAVITCSEDDPADDRIISALESAGAQVFLTTEGNVYCKSDGAELTVAYQ